MKNGEMNSANPNKFLPSQWLKAMKRQFMSTPRTSQSDYESKLPVTASMPLSKQQCHHSSSSQACCGLRSDSPSNSDSANARSQSKSTDVTFVLQSPVSDFAGTSISSEEPQSYFRRSQKFLSRKFSASSEEKKPYYYSKACVHTTPIGNSKDSNHVGSTIIRTDEGSADSAQPNHSMKINYHTDESGFFKSKAEMVSQKPLVSTHLQDGLPTHADFAKEKAVEDSNKHDKREESVLRPPDRKLYRTWFNAHKSKQPSKRFNVLASCSVMSYNILSQTLLEINDYLYRDCDQEILPWFYRWKNIKRELEDFKIDILCLQEVEEVNYHDSIKPWLEKHKYTHSYKRRSGNDANKPDGVLTACLSKKYEIVATVPVEYYRPYEHLTSWHNVGLIMVLKMKGKQDDHCPLICVANTHLVYNPKRGDVKLIQLATFFAEIDKVLKEYREKTGYQLPLVICGDFNSTPFSPLFDLITNGTLLYQGMSSLQISGQKVRRGGRDLPDCLLPERLGVDENCAFHGDESEAPIRSHILRHSLGPLSSSGDRHKSHEATTTQDYGITVDYIFYSTPEEIVASKKRHQNAPSDPSDKPESSDSIPHNVAESRSTSEDISDEKASIPIETIPNENNASEELMQPINENLPRKYELHLNKRLSICSGHAVHKANGLPNRFHSSDHLPVAAKFSVVLSA